MRCSLFNAAGALATIATGGAAGAGVKISAGAGAGAGAAFGSALDIDEGSVETVPAGCTPATRSGAREETSEGAADGATEEYRPVVVASAAGRPTVGARAWTATGADLRCAVCAANRFAAVPVRSYPAAKIARIAAELNVTRLLDILLPESFTLITPLWLSANGSGANREG